MCWTLMRQRWPAGRRSVPRWTCAIDADASAVASSSAKTSRYLQPRPRFLPSMLGRIDSSGTAQAFSQHSRSGRRTLSGKIAVAMLSIWQILTWKPPFVMARSRNISAMCTKCASFAFSNSSLAALDSSDSDSNLYLSSHAFSSSALRFW